MGKLHVKGWGYLNGKVACQGLWGVRSNLAKFKPDKTCKKWVRSLLQKCIQKRPFSTTVKGASTTCLTLVLLSLADLSAMSDLHTQEGTFRDLRFNYLLMILGGAFIVLVIGALILRASTTCCVKQAPPVARPHFKSTFDSFLQKGNGDKS